MSEKLSELVLRECRAAEFSDCDLVFSGLNSDIAGETGKKQRHAICCGSRLILDRNGVH